MLMTLLIKIILGFEVIKAKTVSTRLENSYNWGRSIHQTSRCIQTLISYFDPIVFVDRKMTAFIFHGNVSLQRNMASLLLA
jgi:hypothetical protein